jgi:hypothetical protein
MLRSHGEDELAERAPSVTADELKRIGELGHDYAFSEHALATGPSVGGARALSLATVDLLEGAPRDLRWKHAKLDRDRPRPLDASE